jgi:hypothetical protein
MSVFIADFAARLRASRFLFWRIRFFADFLFGKAIHLHYYRVFGVAVDLLPGTIGALSHQIPR